MVYLDHENASSLCLCHHYINRSCYSVVLCFFQVLYNSPSYMYSRILVGSCLWSIRGQTHDWCHQMINSNFFLLCFKMVENFENLDNILHDWGKIRYKKSLVKTMNMYKKQEQVRKSCFIIRKWLRKTIEHS